MNDEAQIHHLETKVEQLTALVEQLLAERRPHVDSAPAAPNAQAAPVRASRRNMLKLAGAAAAGAVVATTSNVMPAAAVDTEPLKAGLTTSTTSTSASSTVLEYTNTTTPAVDGAIIGTFADANIFNVRDTRSGIALGNAGASSFPAAIAGYSYRTVANGVYGFTANPGYGVVGNATGAAGIGMLAVGAKANLQLLSAGAAPTARTDAHTKGEIIDDTNGDVWVCVVSGSPGTWRKLAGPSTSGSLQLLASPKRVYDSRAGTLPATEPKTPLSAATRTIDCTLNASGVPAGATGLVLNVTAVAVSASGFLSVSPGGSGFSGTSTLNWTDAGAVIANSVTVGSGTGAKIDVTVGGGGNANFIVDVFGFYA